MKTRDQQLSTLSDAVLVEMYRKQDEDSPYAIKALMLRHEAKTVSILRKQLHNIEEEREAMQVAWLKVMEMILSGQYCEQGKFAAWLVHIFYSNAINMLRMRSRSLQNEAVTEELEALHDVDRKINHFETYHDLHIIMSSMREDYREVISRYISGMPVKVIAKFLDKKEGTTYSLNSRAKDYIRAFYAHEVKEELNGKDDEKYFIPAA
jgi:RNA polymerase sigma factor (sigma-70 family)